MVGLATLDGADTIESRGKPAGIAMGGEGTRAFVTAPEAKELVVVSAQALKVVRRVKVGEGPLGVAAHPTGGRVYVADWYKHKVFVVDADGGAIVAEAEVGNSPSGVAVTPDGALELTAARDSPKAAC